jgi:hypothetical protein
MGVGLGIGLNQLVLQHIRRLRLRECDHADLQLGTSDQVLSGSRRLIREAAKGKDWRKPPSTWMLEKLRASEFICRGRQK